MDGRHFDVLARQVGSRRTALGVLLAGLLLPLGAAARGKNKGKDKDNTRKHKGKDRRRAKAQVEPCWRAGACVVSKGSNVSQCNLTNYVAPDPLDCTRCNLSRANLRGADLTGVNFTRANLSGACLVNANFFGATFANTTNLYNAIFCNTTMPDGSVNNSGCGSGTPCCPTCDAGQLCSNGCCNGFTCGACPSGFTCGGGNPGIPGVCGCTAATCASLGKQCGSWPDGCGVTLSCGLCGMTPTPTCNTGTCTTCSAVCGTSCACANLVDGSTTCFNGTGGTTCAPCSTNSECLQGFVCVSTTTTAATAGGENRNLPQVCRQTSPGICTFVVSC